MASFVDNEDARTWADEWVAERLPDGLLESMRGWEAEHERLVRQDFGRLVDQLDVQFAVLAELIDKINFLEKTGWPDHRPLQYVLMAYNAKGFHSATNRLVLGYYEDCFTLTRGLYETFVRLLFVSCHPDAAYSVVMPKPPAGVRQFNLTNFLSHDLRLEWETKYRIFSSFAHSNALSVLQALDRMRTRTGDPERFQVSHAYDPELIAAVAPLLQFTLLTHLRFATECLAGRRTVPNRSVVDAGTEAIDLLTYGLRTHPQAYWRGVSSDLDDLFEMVELADRGGDWQSFIASRRTKVLP